MTTESWKKYRDVIIAAFTFFGLALAFLESDRVTRGRNLPWEEMPLPNGHLASEFHFGERMELKVRSENGLVYGLVLKGREVDWQELETAEYPVLSCIETDLDDLEIGNPPSVVIQTIDCDFHIYPDARTSMRFAILSNGEILLWQKTLGIAEGFGNLAVFFVHIFLMGIGGLLIGGITFGVIHVFLRVVDRQFLKREYILGLQRTQLTVSGIVLLLAICLLLLYLLSAYIGRSTFLTGG